MTKINSRLFERNEGRACLVSLRTSSSRVSPTWNWTISDGMGTSLSFSLGRGSTLPLLDAAGTEDPLVLSSRLLKLELVLGVFNILLHTHVLCSLSKKTDLSCKAHALLPREKLKLRSLLDLFP